jgi:hypothetical protein
MFSLRHFNRYFVWVTIAGVFLPIGGIVFLSIIHDIQMETLTKDIAALVQIHPLAGVLSHFGVLLWWMSTSVWIFSALLHLAAGAREEIGFKLSSAGFSMYLAFDDFFLIHESLAPRYLHLPEGVVVGAIVVGALAYVWFFRRMIFRKDGLWLAAALGFLGASSALDALADAWLQSLAGWGVLLEEASKWAGIVCWCIYGLARCLADGLALSGVREHPDHAVND